MTGVHCSARSGHAHRCSVLVPSNRACIVLLCPPLSAGGAPPPPSTQWQAHRAAVPFICASHIPPSAGLRVGNLPVSLSPPGSEYVKERILALRKQQPGKYQNASVVRTNAMKFLTNYFRKGQLTKLFFLFAVSAENAAPAWRLDLRACSACRAARPGAELSPAACAALARSPLSLRWPLNPSTRPPPHRSRTPTSRRPTTGGASFSAPCWRSMHTCCARGGCCTPSPTWRTWATGRCGCAG